MLIEVRRAMAEEISRVLKFYAERRYGGGIRPEDALLLAEHDGELIGIVRLTTEEGVVVLRGMQVHPRFQRQGIGKRLLGLSPKSWMAKAASASRMRISSVSMAESDST
jgi:N-acetylglutamate synthase-like GNAT family acetyltransferase